jgi:hypothetical protein
LTSSLSFIHYHFVFLVIPPHDIYRLSAGVPEPYMTGLKVILGDDVLEALHDWDLIVLHKS